MLRDHAGLQAVLNILVQHDELVAAEPGNQRIRRQLETQLVGHDAQDAVAHSVAVSVVDFLEAIEIDPDYGAGAARFDATVQPLLQNLPVGQRRERVVMGEKRYVFLSFLAVADIADFQEALLRSAIVDRARGDLDRDRRAICMKFGLELHVLIGQQAIDHVGLGDQVRDHHFARFVGTYAGHPAKARIDRNHLEPAAHDDAFRRHVE